MNICVFDTETTSLDKPFCYNVGYVVLDTETSNRVLRREYVVEQIWHNLPLFQSAYYANKRPLYVLSMRSHLATLDKFGYICAQMRRDFKQYNVTCAYAYSSAFDERVFEFNCDWFKCINPFDEIPIYDIRGLAHHFIVSEKYKRFCEENECFSDSGNYSTTAETMYQYVSGYTDFEEAHTALADAEIEADILLACFHNGAEINKGYCAKRSIERPQERTLHIKTAEQTDYYFDYTKIRINKERTEIVLK